MADATADTRRKPLQDRSRARVAKILTATGELLQEVGYDALTTKEIAARAHTSIGSFYQFFPNKDAVVAELVASYQYRVREFLADAVEQGLRDTDGVTVEWVTSVVDGLGEIYGAMPGFAGIWTGNYRDGPLADRASDLRNEIARALEDFMAGAFPDVSAEDRTRCLFMVVETAKGVLTESDRVTPDEAMLLREELRRMLGLYLASYFTPTGSPRPE